MLNSSIPKISLHNSAVFVFGKIFAEICLKIRNFLTMYTLASLNYTLSVSEYVTTNIELSQLHICTEQIMAVLWSLTCAAAILSLLQENNLSNRIPHRMNCWTETVKHISEVSRNLKNSKNYFIEVKMDKLRESLMPHSTLFQHQLGYVCGLKSSSRKT